MGGKKHVSHNIVLLWTLPFFIFTFFLLILFFFINLINLQLPYHDFFVFFIFFSFLLIIFSFLFNELKYSKITYEFLEHELIYSKGIINLERHIIPYSRIQDVRYTKAFLERIFGLVSIEIETAGQRESKKDLVIKGIPANKKDDIINKIFFKINKIKVEGLGDKITQDMIIENILVQIHEELIEIKNELKNKKENKIESQINEIIKDIDKEKKRKRRKKK